MMELLGSLQKNAFPPQVQPRHRHGFPASDGCLAVPDVLGRSSWQDHFNGKIRAKDNTYHAACAFIGINRGGKAKIVCLEYTCRTEA